MQGVTDLAAATDGKFVLGREDLRTFIENYSSIQPTTPQIEALGGIETIARALCTNLETGLSEEEADTDFVARIEQFGENKFPPAPHKSWFELFWGAFEDTTIVILVIAATISLVLGVTIHVEEDGVGWVEGAAIFIAVLIVAVVTSTNEYQKEKQFRQLNDVKNDKAVKVIRGGRENEVSIKEILVGDVVKLSTGDAIVGDGLFIGGHELKTDESAMTGETHDIPKNNINPIMLSGTQVTAGSGTMLITAVGPDSEWGVTLSRLTDESDPTPLQENLETVATTIGKIGLAVALLTFTVLFISWLVPVIRDATSGVAFDVGRLRSIVDFFIIAVTIVVVAVPEGLPLAVTISLAYSMKEMMKENNLVRHLEACETMGGATNICSDKTGTLTENRMSVVEAYYGETHFDRPLTAADMPKAITDVYVELVSMNGDAFLQEKKVEDLKEKKTDDDKRNSLSGDIPLQSHKKKKKEKAPVDIMTLDKGLLRVVGNKTEGALLFLARDLGYNYETIRSQVKIHKLWTFSSERKRMSVIVKHGSAFRLYCKGASEAVLADCTSQLMNDGSVTPLTKDGMENVGKVINLMASKGLRTLVLAYRDFEQDLGWGEKSTPPDSDLTFVALVGIKDPVRVQVPGAVKRCREAGITVRMCTGDNEVTAKFIAEECKIIDEANEKDTSEEALRYRVLLGPVFRNLPRAKLDIALKHLRVLARSSPSDKHLLVSRLRELGEVVAVTGDGTNDAPALKVADVGLSMGIEGTEVAKEASDIVIMDDNFASIVAAVKWGRGVYDNIRKFIQFQLTVNVVALLVAFIGAMSQRGTPLTAVQLLWVNLIMDTLAALALGTEVPEESLLLKKPYGRFDRLISVQMWKNIFGQSLFQLCVLFVILYLGPYIFQIPDGSRYHYTIVFNVFVWCQIFNEFNSRKVNNELNIFSNLRGSYPFLGVMIATIGLQILIVSIGGEFVKTVPLSVGVHFVSIGIGAWCLLVGLVIRLVPSPKLAPPQPPAPPAHLSVFDEESDSGSDSDQDPDMHVVSQFHS